LQWQVKKNPPAKPKPGFFLTDCSISNSTILMKDLLLVLLFFHCAASTAEENPEAWSIKSYPCYFGILSEGLLTETQGLLHLPEPPTDNPDAIRSFIQRSTEIFRAHAPDLPLGSLIVLDRERGTLAAKTTEDGHAIIESLLEEWTGALVRTINAQVDLIEVPLSELEPILSETRSTHDHSTILVRLEQSGFPIIASAALTTKSGQNVSSTVGSTYPQITQVTINPDTSAQSITTDTMPLGLTVEIDHVLRFGGRIIDLGLSIQHLTPSTTKRQIPVGTLDGNRIQTPVQDAEVTKWDTAIALRSGSPRLLTILPSLNPDCACLFFVSICSPALFTSKSNQAEDWLKNHGLTEQHHPPLNGIGESTIPAGMKIQKFRVPPNFLSLDDSQADPFDPFAANATSGTFATTTAEGVLKAQGIPFPDGASAAFFRHSSTLVVLNTPENLELIESNICECSPYPLSAQFTLHIIEAETPTIRRITKAAHRLSDHQIAWEQLQAEVTAGRAHLVDVASIETKSGQRAYISAGRFYAFPQTALTPHPSKPKEFTATIGRELIGITLEIDPIIGGDHHTIDIDVSIKRHAQSPTEHFEIPPPQENSIVIDAPNVTFHTQQLTLPTTTVNGMRRLLGTWQAINPNGQLNPARTQAIFIQANIIEVKD
jgi:hypothetical protein